MIALRQLVRLASTDCRRGVPGLVGPLLVAVALGFPLLSGSFSFGPGLADPLNLVLTATGTVLAPIAAAGAALHSHRTANSSLPDLAASAPVKPGPITVFVVCGISISAWSTLALAGLTAVILPAADFAGPITSAMWLLPATAAVTLCFAVVYGTVLGLVARGQWISPVAGGSLFLLVFLGSYLPSPARILSPTFPEIYYRLWSEPNGTVLLAQIFLLLASAVNLCLVPLHRFRRMRQPSFGLAGWAILGATATLGVMMLALGATSEQGLDATKVRSPPDPIPCQESDQLRLCTWPESLLDRDATLPVLSDVRMSLAGSGIPLPRTFSEFGLPVAGGVIYTPSIGGVSVRDLAVRSFTDRYVPCDRQTSVDASATLTAYAYAFADGDAETVFPAANRILRLPVAERRLAVEQLIGRISCST